MSTTKRSPFEFRTRALARLSAPLVLALVACHDAGGTALIVGTGGPPGGPVMDVDFSLRTDLHLGRGFLGDVRHADLDGDGISDLAETNFLARFVTIALGNIDGTFLTITELPTAGNAWRVELVDANEDGMKDIAVLGLEYQSTGQSSLQVFLQGPNPAEFSMPPVTLNLSSNPRDIRYAPRTGVTGDTGPIEFFLSMADDQEIIRVDLNGGVLVQTGALDSAALGAPADPLSLTVVDLGRTGFLDLVVSEVKVPGGGSDRIISYPRDATGFGGAGMVLAPVARGWVYPAGDVDGNTYDDVAVAQILGKQALLLAGDGNGLSTVVPIDFGAETTSLIFEDLDGDGLKEAIGTTLLFQSVQVHRASSPLMWLDPVHYNVGAVPRAISTLFLPGVALPALLCGNSQDLSIMLPLGDARFRAPLGYSTESFGPRTLQTADLDNDGDADVVTMSHTHELISFIEGAGDGTFETKVVLPGMPTTMDEPGHIVIVDFDVDGKLDVLASMVELAEVRLYRGDGTVSGYRDPLPGDVFTVGSEPLGIDVGDLTGDTQPDILVCNSGDGTIQTLRNIGGGNVQAEPPISVGFKPKGVLLLELDGDGSLDAVVYGDDSSGSLIAVFGGDGDGGFTQDDTYVLDGPTNNIEMGDLNEDGRLDVVVGQTAASETRLFIFLNGGNLLLDPRPTPVDPGPATVVVADANGDMHLDLLVGTSAGELKILFGDGSGGFPNVIPGRGELPLPELTLGMRYTDTDGDQLEDLILVHTKSPFLWVARNVSVALP